MNKISKEEFKIKGKKEIHFDFQDMVIVVSPSISLNTKITLISSYIETINSMFEFYGSTVLATVYLQAEYKLMLAMLDHLTNIDVSYDEKDKTNNIDVDIIVDSGLWDLIVSHMPYYEDFRKELSGALSIVYQKQSIKKMLGTFLENGLSSIMPVLENLSNMNAEDMAKYANQFTKELEELNKKVPGITK